MMVTQQTFGFRQGQPNAGFVRELWLLRTSDVVAVLDPVTYPVANQPMMVSKAGVLVTPGATVTRLALPTRTATFEETMKLDRSGRLYEQKIDLALPRPTTELARYIYANVGAQWVVFWNDGNGEGWLAGEPNNGLRMDMTHDQTEANALRIGLTGRSVYPVWRLESTCLSELFPDAAFDYSFDLSFDS